LHLAEEVDAYGQELSQRYGYPVQGFRVFVHEAERVGFENREWTYVHKDGHHLPVQLSVNAVRDAHGRLIGYLGIAQDLTERHRQDQVLRHAKTAAEAASAAKSMFLANMSHEIRTPMNAVLGIAHLLADTRLDDDQRQLLAKLQIAGRSLLGVINDVLDISKIEAGEMHAESVAFSPGDLLGELHQLYAPQASSKGVDMELRGADTLPAALLGDPTRLRQVLSNLLSNAIKFTSQGGVSLQVVQEPPTTLPDDPVWLKFSVVDTGEGISGDALENLFNPFAQADASTTRRFGGTGLGLSIVKRLSQLMGGDVGVNSALGAGSTFWVRLPFMEVGEEKLSLPSVSDQGQLNVVVVDDSDLDRAHLVQLCQAFGWRATALSSGTELVHWMQDLADAHQPLPDALIVDWRMPDLDGIEALNTIAERIGPAELPAALVVSAYERDQVARHDHAGVVSRILTKPVNPSTLFNAVNASVAELTGKPDQVMESTKLEAMEGQWLSDMKILLVDDSDINLEVASRMLQREGAMVEVCTDGQEALQALAAMKDTGAHFDAVLMDVQMPIMDGYEATRRVRAQLGLTDLPIIALTAGALEEERRRARAAGMDAFLTKPLDPAQLVRTVHSQVTRVRGAVPESRLDGPVDGAPPSVDWPDIEGIHSGNARRMMQGDVNLFFSLLQRFVGDYGRSLLSLTDSPSDEERNTLTARVHKLRGSSGMLAATQLHALTTELETALRGGATDVDALIASVNDALRKLTASADSAFAQSGALHKPPQPTAALPPAAGKVSAATMHYIRALQQLLAQQDLAAMQSFESLAPDLLAVLGPQGMEALSGAVHSLDFATAARILSSAWPEDA
jgi:signal transduction histidine kinase/DNA-binding response OmpR family regulator